MNRNSHPEKSALTYSHSKAIFGHFTQLSNSLAVLSLFFGLLCLFFQTQSHAEEKHTVREPLPSADIIAALPKDGGKEFNRLVFATSPYLRQHARNPVDWYPWGQEAFDRAKKENKPIFLSVGYSSCHWCHVMEHQSFEDNEVAEILNKSFINIKVDREERPDIDQIYMNATQLMRSRGGWPNSVFLDPLKRPWFCGTYFPKEQFINALTQLENAWQTKRPEVDETARAFQIELQRLSYRKLPPADTVIDRSALDRAIKELRGDFDADNGGFGGAPKFPPHGSLDLILYEVRQGKEAALDMATKTLDKMALGGIHDHVGGGFHRYATDAIWFLPHFEKMLYDNGQLGHVYTEAFQVTKNPVYERTARRLFDWVLKDMLDSRGGFYSAYDADSEGEEGVYYLWKRDEVLKLLGEEKGSAFCDAYQITEAGTYYEEATGEKTADCIPCLKGYVTNQAQRAEFDAALAQLHKTRYTRVPPMLDDKVLTSWNGLMIGAFAIGGQALKEPRYTAAAEKAADFIWNNMRKEGQLLRTYREGNAQLNGYLDDYSFLACGLLDLYEVTQNKRWLDAAAELVDQIEALFLDKESGGYFFTSNDHEELLSRNKDPFDGAIPSGNGMTAQAQIRLGILTGDENMVERGRSTIRTFEFILGRSTRANASMLLPLAMYHDHKTATGQSIPVANTANASNAFPDVTSIIGPVTVNAKLEKKEIKPGEAIPFSITIDLKKNWHVYSNKPKADYMIPTVVRLADDKQPFTMAKPTYPETEVFTFEGETMRVYRNQAIIKGSVTLKPDTPTGPLTLTLICGCQACDEATNVCVAPEDHELKIPVTVIAAP